MLAQTQRYRKTVEHTRLTLNLVLQRHRLMSRALRGSAIRTGFKYLVQETERVRVRRLEIESAQASPPQGGQISHQPPTTFAMGRTPAEIARY